MQDGVEVDLSDYPRYRNPYCASAFRDDVIAFEYEDPAGVTQTRTLTLDVANRAREVSHFLD